MGSVHVARQDREKAFLLSWLYQLSLGKDQVFLQANQSNSKFLAGLCWTSPLSLDILGPVSINQADSFLRLDTSPYGHHFRFYCACLKVEDPALPSWLLLGMHPAKGFPLLPPLIIQLPGQQFPWDWKYAFFLPTQGREQCESPWWGNAAISWGAYECCNFPVEQAYYLSQLPSLLGFLMCDSFINI